MKLRPVGAELFYVDTRTDGQTDMTKLTVAFHNFENTPKHDSFISYFCVRKEM